MRGKRFWSWVLVVATIVLSLGLTDHASAESGCHRSGGTPSGSGYKPPNQ
jgi:hypothetical protein